MTRAKQSKQLTKIGRQPGLVVRRAKKLIAILSCLPLVRSYHFWALYHNTYTVWVYRASGQITHLSVEDSLSGEEVLAGFTCPVVEVLPG